MFRDAKKEAVAAGHFFNSWIPVSQRFRQLDSVQGNISNKYEELRTDQQIPRRPGGLSVGIFILGDVVVVTVLKVVARVARVALFVLDGHG